MTHYAFLEVLLLPLIFAVVHRYLVPDGDQPLLPVPFVDGQFFVRLGDAEELWVEIEDFLWVFSLRRIFPLLIFDAQDALLVEPVPASIDDKALDLEAFAPALVVLEVD